MRIQIESDSRNGHRRHKINIRDDTGARIYRRRYAPDQLRALCDLAVDALENEYRQGGNLESFDAGNGMIELRHTGPTDIKCLILTRAHTQKLIALIDESLEKYGE